MFTHLYLRLSRHRFDNPISCFGRKPPQTACWGKTLSWGASGVLRLQAVFLGYILCEYSQCFRVLTCGYPSIVYTPSTQVFRFRFCGCFGIRSPSTAHTPGTRSIQAFGTAHTPSTHSSKAFSTAHTPSPSGRKCTRYSILSVAFPLRILISLGFSDLPRAPAPLCDHGLWMFDKS